MTNRVIKTIKRFPMLVGNMARHPVCAFHGVREFRIGFTMAWDDDAKSEAYDSGREVAHLATLRKFEC